MSETLNLEEHEFRSIRRWLNTLIGAGKPILIHRPTSAFSRPAFVLTKTVPRQFTERGRGLGVESESGWQIEVLAERTEDTTQGFWEAHRQVVEISERLLTNRVVPLYLWGWQYPPAEVEVVAGGGSLPAGQLSVIVTAVNHQDEESLGEAVEVTVAAGDAVKVWLSPWPRQSGVAKEFRVYAGAEGAETLQGVVQVGTDSSLTDSSLSVAFDLLALAGGGAVSPDSSVFFYRFMRLESVETEVLEHPESDGVFNGYVRFGMSVLSQRRFPFALPLVDVSVSDLEVV